MDGAVQDPQHNGTPTIAAKSGTFDPRSAARTCVFRIEQVDTAFLEDEKLGSNGLLGMSVLGRYKLTIDDANNAIILSGKETDPRPGGSARAAPRFGRRPVTRKAVSPTP